MGVKHNHLLLLLVA